MAFVLIKVSTLLHSGPAPEKEQLVIFDFPTACTFGNFVRRLVKDGGLFVSDQQNDWVPLHRVVRVWQSGK